MRNKKYLWVWLYLIVFTKLCAVQIESDCRIGICEKDDSKYKINGKTYKEILDNSIGNEFIEIHKFFNKLGFLEGLEDGIKITSTGENKHQIYYYYNKKISIIDAELTRNRLSSLHPTEKGGIKDSNNLGFYFPPFKRLHLNVAEYLSIDDYLAGKSGGNQDFIVTLAHEMFHATQKSTKKNELSIWLNEPTAEAVGKVYAYSTASIANRNMFLDIPFNYTDNEDLAYARYPFFIWLGNKISSPNNIAYLKNFRNQEGNGLKSFQASLKSVIDKKFSELLVDYLTLSVFNNPKAYVTLDAELTREEKALYIPQINSRREIEEIKIKLTKENEESKEFIIKRNVKALAVSPDILMAKYINLGATSSQDLLRLVTINVEAKKGKEDLILVHEDKVYTKNHQEIEPRIVRILIKADKEVKLGLMKVVNVAKDLTMTEKRNFKLVIKEEPFRFYPLSCFSSNKAVDMSIDNLRGLEQTFPIFNAKKVYLKPRGGSFAEGTTMWTAPSGNGVLEADLIFEDVILHDNKDGKKDKDIEIKNFTKVRYSSSGLGCGAKMTLSTGESLIYNAEKNTTMMKDGSSTLLLKKPFMYMREPSEGWCHINFESFSKMMFGNANSIFGRDKRKEFVKGLLAASNEIASLDPKMAGDIRKGLRKARKTQFDAKSITLPDGDIITSPQDMKKEFDFYRLPNALNKMLSLKRLRQILKSRRIGKHGDELYVATAEDVYIKLSRKPCKTEKGKCNFALFGEKNGEKIKILYNKENLISTLSSDGTVMRFDYGLYPVENVPNSSPSCFTNN